jgi:hypothetical protein
LSSKNLLDKDVVGVLESNYDEISASSVLRQKEARESYLRKFQMDKN